LLYNIFREENGRAEAERRLSKEYSGRTVKMALKILAKLDEGNVLDNEKILLRLRRYITQFPIPHTALSWSKM
jgi:hypothetical protein